MLEYGLMDARVGCRDGAKCQAREKFSVLSSHNRFNEFLPEFLEDPFDPCIDFQISELDFLDSTTGALDAVADLLVCYEVRRGIPYRGHWVDGHESLERCPEYMGFPFSPEGIEHPQQYAGIAYLQYVAVNDRIVQRVIIPAEFFDQVVLNLFLGFFNQLFFAIRSYWMGG